MSQSTHPSTALLVNYIDTPDSNEFNDIRQHLTNCTQCRNQTMKLTQLNHNIVHNLPRFLESNNKNELKSALHSATHSAAMNRHLNSLTENGFSQRSAQEFLPKHSANTSSVKASEASNNTSGGFIEFIADILTIRFPVWASVPVTAAVVFAVTLALFPATDIPVKSDISIAVYQDNPVIIFNKSKQVPSGLGFFDNANQKKEPFNSISVVLKKDNSLHLKWTPIVNANSYIINLYLVDGANRKLIGEMNAINAEVIFLNSHLESGRRYEWSITGKTADNLSFQTNGGFIVSSKAQ